MKKRMTWSFERMHPVLQIVSLAVAGVALIGWFIGGAWMLYAVMA